MALEDHIVGPGTLYIGDPTEALGAGMMSLGYIEGDVTIQLGGGGIRVKNNGITKEIYARSGHPISLTAPLQSMNKDVLVKYLTAATKTGDSLGFDNTVRPVKRFTLVFVPDMDLDGSGQPMFVHTLWIPGACVVDPGQLTFQTVGNDIADSTNIRTTVFEILETAEVDSVAIPKETQMGFFGDPSDFGITGWTLPLSA